MTILRSSAALLLLALLACEEKQAPPATPETVEPDRTPVVYTTFYPTEYFVSRIGGEDVDVTCPLPPDADPIFWQPSRDQIAAYQQADLIVVNGAGFEKWIDTVSLPESRVLDSAAAFEDEFVTYESTTHAHGPGGEHTHEGIDGHTWLDPVNATRQAKAIRDALVQRFPSRTDAYRVGYVELSSDLDALDARYQALDLEGVQLLASHPAYNYLDQRYEWNIHNFDLDPESEIDAATLTDIQAELDPDARVHVMLWESEPVDAARAALDEAGIVSVTFSPAELIDPEARAAGEDYLTIMNANLDRLQAALGEPGEG